MHKLVNNTEIDLKQIGHENVDPIHATQDTEKWHVLVNIVVNLGIP